MWPHGRKQEDVFFVHPVSATPYYETWQDSDSQKVMSTKSLSATPILVPSCTSKRANRWNIFRLVVLCQALWIHSQLVHLKN